MIQFAFCCEASFDAVKKCIQIANCDPFKRRNKQKNNLFLIGFSKKSN